MHLIRNTMFLSSAMTAMFSHANTSVHADPLLISEIVEAKPIKRVNPRYPISAAKRNQEGYAIYSFIVEKDGSVSSPILEDSSGNRSINNAAKRALSKWKYKPASENGKPVQQCNQSVRIDFSLDGNDGAKKSFVRAYKRIGQLITDKNFDTAKTEMDKLRSNSHWNLYEQAWFSQLEGIYYAAIGKKTKQLESLRSAVSGIRRYLPIENIRDSYVNIFALSVERNRFAQALDIYKRLEELEGSEKQISFLEPYVDQVTQMVASDKIIVNQAIIPSSLRWHHKLVRNSFSIEDVNGGLTELEVRCNNKVYTYKVNEKSLWTIPKNYGQCNIYVQGNIDTSFKLVEIPTNKKQA